MKHWLQPFAWLLAAIGTVAGVKCATKPDEPTPEQLLEQQPTGAGKAPEELEPRPGYLRARPSTKNDE